MIEDTLIAIGGANNPVIIN